MPSAFDGMIPGIDQGQACKGEAEAGSDLRAGRSAIGPHLPWPLAKVNPSSPPS